LLFFRIRQARKASSPIAMTPRGTATPTPIFAPVVMPLSSLEEDVGEGAAVPVVAPDAALPLAVDALPVGTDVTPVVAAEEGEDVVLEEVEEEELVVAAVWATLMEE